jgi:DNA-binding transcriptional LysR family regulator
MMRYDLTTLRIFVAVYNLKSLTRAAAQEHIASSAISKRINDLETELGVALFYRHPRGVTATPAGDVLARHARSLFAGVNAMAAELSAHAGGECGQVRINAHTSAMYRFLPTEIASFSNRYPQVRIIVREQITPNVVQSLQDGIADIGIVASNVALPPGLIARVWREDELVALVRATDPLAVESSVPFAALAERALISVESGSSLQLLLEEAADALGVRLNNRLEVATMWSAAAMAAAGLGVAIVPAWLIESLDSSMVAVPLTDPWARRQLTVVVRDRVQLHSSVRLMLDHLFASTPYPHEIAPVPNE